MNLAAMFSMWDVNTLHARIHREQKGCCCPGQGVLCPDCPQHRAHVHEPSVVATVTLHEPLHGRKQARFWRCSGCAGMVFDGEYWYRREKPRDSTPEASPSVRERPDGGTEVQS